MATSSVFISDSEAETDLLHYEAIAKTILRLVDGTGDKPISIGVHGDWGAGKSTVLRLIENQVKIQTDSIAAGLARPLCLRFTTWEFQGFEDVKMGLLEAIITKVRDSRPKSARVAEQVVQALRNIDYLKLAKKAAQWGTMFYTGIPHPEAVTGVVGSFKALLDIGHDKVTPEAIERTVIETEGLLKPGNGPKVPEQIEAFKRDFCNLIEVAEISKLIILIDDLDRCLPATVIESMEAIRLFLFTERTAFVVAADEAMVQYSVKQHFPDLPNSQGTRTYALNYLEKLIQVPFRIPPLGTVEIQHYITLALTEAALGSDHDAFLKLVNVSRECSREPWKAERIRPEIIAEHLKGHLDDSIKQLILQSDQLHQLMAKGTEGNPRQIKRFLNALLLRREIATARGFEKQVELPVLAKLMLAEYYKDDFYSTLESLVFQDPNGRPAELQGVENDLAQVEPTKFEEESEGGKVSSKASTWRMDEWIRDWAATKPELAGKDLRPYFFISRDKKVFFPGLELPNRLASTVEALMANSASLRRPMVQKLDSKDAGQVAAEIRNRILADGEFDEEPEGIVGLNMLAELHSQTRAPFLALIKSLPEEKLGGWAGQPLLKLKTYGETAAEAALFAEQIGRSNPRIGAMMRAAAPKQKK